MMTSRNMFENLCGTCKHKNCCTDSAVPLVFPKELKKIKRIDTEHIEHISEINISGKIVNIIKKKDKSKQCVYWDESSGGCKIYEYRPIDCKLYPFDILYVNDSYHWIVYSCNNNSDWKWTEEHLVRLENDDGFDELMNNIDVFSEHTEIILPEEERKTPFTVLRKVKYKIK